MLPVTNSYWFRESYLSKFCFIIICEERKQKVLILNSSEKFIMISTPFFFFLKNVFPNCKMSKMHVNHSRVAVDLEKNLQRGSAESKRQN